MISLMGYASIFLAFDTHTYISHTIIITCRVTFKLFLLLVDFHNNELVGQKVSLSFLKFLLANYYMFFLTLLFYTFILCIF